MEKVIFLEKTVSEESAPKSIKDVYKRMETLFKTEPSVEREIQIQLGSMTSQLYHNALNNEEGYCYKFSLPIVAVNSIFKKIRTSPAMVEECFRNDWKFPKNTHMYSD